MVVQYPDPVDEDEGDDGVEYRSALQQTLTLVVRVEHRSPSGEEIPQEPKGKDEEEHQVQHAERVELQSLDPVPIPCRQHGSCGATRGARRVEQASEPTKHPSR